MRVIGFNFREEDEKRLQDLSARLRWGRSQLIRELLARAVIREPTLQVQLSPAPDEVPDGS
jgi:hypothetical protein